MADDLELLDSTDEDEKEAPPPVRPRGGAMTGDEAPPVLPVRNITAPVAPAVTSNAPPPPMPITRPNPQPTLGQAILGSIGSMPHAGQDRFNAMNAQGPPILHGWKGALDAIAQGTRARGIEAAIPGTPGNYNRKLGQAEKNAVTESGLNAANLKQELEPETAQGESDLRAAQTNRENAQAAKDLAPVAPKNESPQQGYAQAIQDAINRGVDPAKDPHVLAWKTAIEATQKQPTQTFQEQSYDEWHKTHPNGTRMQFDKELKDEERTPRQPTDREEWQKDHPNEPIENYWAAKAGAGANAKAATAEEAGRAAQAYADDYLKSGHFTGTGDEALMEKYFELAKPSSGFRMTQPQIEMLTRAQDIMNSVVAKGKHLFSPESPYFSEDLRKQIVETMRNLETSREEAKTGGGKGKAAKDLGDAGGKPEGSTGTLSDGTKVKVVKGRIVSQ